MKKIFFKFYKEVVITYGDLTYSKKNTKIIKFPTFLIKIFVFLVGFFLTLLL